MRSQTIHRDASLPTTGSRRPGLRFRPVRSSIVCAALFCGAMATFPGCDDPELGTIDAVGRPPFLLADHIAPESVALETLTPSGDHYTVSFIARVKVTDPDSTPGVSVAVSVYRPRSTDLVVQTALQDAGSGPDSIAGDGIYTGTVEFSLTLAEAGPYRVEFTAADPAGLNGNSLERLFSLTRPNRPPELANVVAPDTVTAPTDNSAIPVILSVQASDPDGPEDITSVWFRNLSFSDPNFRFPLYDNGDPDYGDEVAGDGRFSTLIPITRTSARRTNSLLFQASDAAGDTSASVLHFLTVR